MQSPTLPCRVEGVHVGNVHQLPGFHLIQFSIIQDPT